MKIQFIGDEKGMITNLVKWINEYTKHEAALGEKLKAEKGEIVPLQMPQPDIVICIDNFVTWEDLHFMGVTNPTDVVRAIYVTGAPRRRGGASMYDFRFRDFNDLYFGQTEQDEKLFYKEGSNPINGEMEREYLFEGLTYLPIPFDVNSVDTVKVKTDKLRIAHTESALVMAGAYNRGFYFIRNARKKLKFDISLIFGLPHDECLEKKAQCNLSFDNHMGNVGVTGFESLTQGIATIGRLHPMVFENLKRLSNGEDFPALTFTDENELESILSNLADNPKQLKKLGKESREWMIKNYSNENIAQYWCEVLQNKLKNNK